MLPGVVLAALAGLSPAAPLPCRVLEGEPRGLDTDTYPWVLLLGREGLVERHKVPAGLVLTVEGRRAGLGELPGLCDHYWDARGVWHPTRSASCRAWTRGGRLEALEISLR